MPNPFLDNVIDEIKTSSMHEDEHKTTILRVPHRVYVDFVLSSLQDDESIWRTKNLDYYLLDQFPEIKELSSARLKKQVKNLARLKFIEPQTVVSVEGDICDKIMLVVGGQIETFRKIKELREDNKNTKHLVLSLEPR